MASLMFITEHAIGVERCSAGYTIFFREVFPGRPCESMTRVAGNKSALCGNVHPDSNNWFIH